MRTPIVTLGVVAAIAAAATVAAASEHGHRGGREDREHEDREHGEREGSARRTSTAPVDAEALALYRKECGACHLAFPPGLLPAASHRRILAGLDRHFGQNAELDDATRGRLERFLVANAADAGRGAREAPAGADGAPLRITEAAWFQREHRRAARAAAANPAVGSLARCAACHPGAERWDFDEHGVRIPGR